MTSLFETNELETEKYFQSGLYAADLRDYPLSAEVGGNWILEGTSGDDWIDTTFIDANGDTLETVDDINPGAGNDYIELLKGDGSSFNVNLGEGSDVINVGYHDFIKIFGFSDDDTLQFSGQNITLELLDEKKINVYEGEDYTYFFIFGGIFDVTVYNSEFDFLTEYHEGMNGSDGDDLIITEYSFINHKINAGKGNDTIVTGDGDDTIYGISGNNFIESGYGSDVIYTGSHTSEVDAGYGRDVVYVDLSKGADHIIDVGAGKDTLHLENASVDRASHVTVKGWNSNFETFADLLFIEGEHIDYLSLPQGMSLSASDDGDAVLSFGENDTITFQSVSLNELFATYSDQILSGTDGDDWIDATYVDFDYDTFSTVYEVNPGTGNDYVEVSAEENLNIHLEDGSDIINVTFENGYWGGIYISGFSTDDTLQLNGKNVTLGLLESLNVDVIEDAYHIELSSYEDGVYIILDGTDFDFLTEYHESLNGTNGDDLITVDNPSLDHEINAGKGSDTVVAGDGDDTIYGVSGNNVIDGGEGDDEIHTGRHTSEIDAGYGSDTIYADLLKGADHVVDLGEYDWDQDELHLENVSLDRASHVTVKGWDTYHDQLYIAGRNINFEALPDGMTFSLNEDADAVLLFDDDETLTFSNASIYDLIGGSSDGVVSGTDGDDWIDATYVDLDYDSLAFTDSIWITENVIRPGEGNDYIEVSAEEDFIIELDKGSDVVNVVQGDSYLGQIKIYGFSDDDTFLLSGQEVTRELLEELELGFSEFIGEDFNRITIWDTDHSLSVSITGDKGFNFLHEYQDGVNGTNGDDLITSDYSDRDGESVGDGNDLVNAGAGNDIVKGYNGADTLYGGSGDDAVYGDRGNNFIFGEDGNDTLDSGRHSSTIEGGEGNDYIIASMHKGGDHILSGGEGFDTVELRYHEASKISNIVIQDFSPDQDTLKLGDELLDLSNLPDGATLANNGDDHAVLTLATGDTVEFEHITTNALLGIVEPNDQVDGTDYADVINLDFVDGEGEMVGNTDDLVYAGSGQDTVYGYRGADTIYGGSGHDEIDGLKGQNELYGETGDDTISSGKHTSLLDGGHGDDMLLADLGSGGDHTLTGGTGYDRLYLGDASDKKLSAVTVSDFDPEKDTLVIEDSIVEFGNLMSGWSLSENEDGHAVLSFNDDDTVTLQGVGLSDLGIELPEPGTVGIVDGTSGSDFIDETFSDNEGDMLTDGNDTIMAGAGDDEVIADRGNDIVYGGAGNDYIGSLRGSNELYGEEGDDALVALRHTSLLDGGAGNDILGGDLSKGADHTMTGGEGVDTFVVVRMNEEKVSDVTITDFEAASETLYIDETVVEFSQLADDQSLVDNEDGHAVLNFGFGDSITFVGVTAQELEEANPMSDLFIPMSDEELEGEVQDELGLEMLF